LSSKSAYVTLDHKTSLKLYGYLYTLKNAGLFQTKFGSNMDKPKPKLG